MRVGDRFGMLTVIQLGFRKQTGKASLCLCDCGNAKIIKDTNLRAGNTKSCGCLHQVLGLSTSPTYHAWESMKQRCTNPNNPKYKDYGGRGILIQDSWLQFINFVKDMGEKPTGMFLDRIDVNGNYCKDNCRWATIQESASNKRGRDFMQVLDTLSDTEVESLFQYLYNILAEKEVNPFPGVREYDDLT